MLQEHGPGEEDIRAISDGGVEPELAIVQVLAHARDVFDQRSLPLYGMGGIFKMDVAAIEGLQLCELFSAERLICLFHPLGQVFCTGQILGGLEFGGCCHYADL